MTPCMVTTLSERIPANEQPESSSLDRRLKRAYKSWADEAIWGSMLDRPVNHRACHGIDPLVADQEAGLERPINPVGGLFVRPPGHTGIEDIERLGRVAPERVVQRIAAGLRMPGNAGALALKELENPTCWPGSVTKK
ncbi:MAG: hypothetical protein IH586_09230 [Anaerolineaceae bacterium]|nr:hypothetical protein [Anaerolineaceae bacterium]